MATSHLVVNICTNYLAKSLSDFSEIIPQISKKCTSAHCNFKISRGGGGGMPPDPIEEALAVIATRSQILGVSEFQGPPRDSNPGSAIAVVKCRTSSNMLTAILCYERDPSN